MNDIAQPSRDSDPREELSGVLLQAVESVLREPIAEDDLARILHRLRQLDDALARRRPRFSRLLLVAVSVAAGLLIAVLLWRDPHSVAWSQVVEAVGKKPWLHAVTLDGTAEEELWFSAHRAALAGRVKPREGLGDEWVTWIDYDSGTSESYVPKENVIHRMKDNTDRYVDKYFEAIFRAFLSADAGRTIGEGRLQLVHQAERVVWHRGRRCIEHRFSVRDQKAQDEGQLTAGESQWFVYVDPDTHLPFKWKEVSSHEGLDGMTESVQQWRVDYPETGPTTIYALGAPRTAKVVERVLDPVRPDVERLAAEVRAARWRPDRYYALVVESRDDQHWSQGDTVYRVWRSGSRWRVERSIGHVTRPREPLASKDADPASWWRTKSEKLRFRPDRLCDGKWVWRYETKFRRATPAEIAAGFPEDEMVAASVAKQREHPIVRRDDPWADDGFSNMGHTFGPAFGPLFGATIETKPKSGPPGSILLEVRNPSWKPETYSPGRYPQAWRFWIDPQHSYLVMRTDLVVPREGKEERVFGSSVIEDVTQDPHGQWYPAVVRQLECVGFVGSNKVQDRIVRFYYDFNTPIPDAVFEP